ncbi:MAG: ankyrin repeat domain-containing protein [Acidobacteriota bacterium]
MSQHDDESSAPKRGGLPVVDQASPPDADRAFLEAPREISTPEFLDALFADNREEVAKLIVQDDRLVKSRDGSGSTAILLAVYHGLDEMLGVLLRSEVELDLFEAAAVGDAGRVGALIAEDPQGLVAASGDGFPALTLACHFGHEEAAGVLLDAGASVTRPAENPSRVQPIHASLAHRGDGALVGRLVARLLAAGADVEAEQAGGFRPLHQAAGRGDVALVRQLLDAGAESAPEADLGQTPHSLATEREHADVVAFFDSL